METMHASKSMASGSRSTRIAGRIIRVICILFLLFDATGKIFREAHSVSGTTGLGWPDQSVQLLGSILLVFTIIYSYPKTAILGAILLTGYLGGAAATMIRAGQPLYFSVFIGILVWAGLFLNNRQLRSLIPLDRTDADD
jgi:hypothetical protein